MVGSEGHTTVIETVVVVGAHCEWAGDIKVRLTDWWVLGHGSVTVNG